MNWEILIKIGHIVGTVLGVGGATFAEIFSIQAAKAGKLDETAGRFMHLTYTVIRLGILLLVVSGFGYLLLLRLEGHSQYIYGPRVWAKLLITLIILVNAILLQARKIPLRWGSAISFTSWYAALIIGSWRGLPAGFRGIMIGYGVAILLVYWVQGLIRKKLGART